MKKLDLDLDVGTAEMSELKSVLDAAISDHFADGFLRHRWEGDVLRLSGPGARGSLVRRDGRLKLQAELRAPASWAHRVIRRKIDAALGDVAAHIEQRG
ncbi:MAG: hypothetical protein GY719_13870 [bacterium]|nr:hypothetical protein [bacterium]